MTVTFPKSDTILHHNISWQKFEEILAELGDKRSSKVAYDRGILEIMTPLPEHEGYKEIIGDLIKDLADELELDYESFGSTTWKKEATLAGSEPDNCFYFQNERFVRGRLNIDLAQDPPPDLVLEIDITSKSLNRLPIYARLGVPEIWRYDRCILKIYQLRAGQYQATDFSLAFPSIPIKEIPDFIVKNIVLGRRKLRQQFRVWVRQKIQEKNNSD